MSKEIEIRALGENGEQTLVKAVAVIAIVRNKEGFILDVRENGDLTEDFWRALPTAMGNTIDEMLEERRRVNPTQR